MDVYVCSEIGECKEFKEAPKKTKQPVSIVISPIRIQGDEAGTLKVINGCNMWHGCWNEKCFFSIAARSQPITK